MTRDISELKSALRERMRAELKQMTAEARAEASARACRILLQQPVWRRAQSALLYASLPPEIDLMPLIEQGLRDGKAIALPRFDPSTNCYSARRLEAVDQLCTGRFGIPEPPEGAPAVPLNQLDLVLVPGLAFDPRGRRLGRGKGFYDRLLAAVPGAKCGVAHDVQVLDEIPVELHDIVMNFILTPTRWLGSGPGAA